MSTLDQRLRAILSERDAPDADEAFVARVMVAARRPAPARPAVLPAYLQPLGWMACLVAIGAVAPFLVEGLAAALRPEEIRLASASLVLVVVGWIVLGALRRSYAPALAR